MIVSVAVSFGHLLTHLLEGTAVLKQVLDDMPIAIGASLKFSLEKVGRLLAIFMVEPHYIMHVMVVHNEPPSLFRNFRLGILHILRDFPNFEKDSAHIAGEVGDMREGVGL